MNPYMPSKLQYEPFIVFSSVKQCNMNPFKLQKAPFAGSASLILWGEVSEPETR